MDQPTIKTERLLLRPFTLTDAKNVQKFAGNINVSKTTLNIPHPYSDGTAEEWIKTHQKNWHSKSEITYAITISNTSLLIGAISLISIKDNQAEIGYWIGEPFWGNGYCTESTKAIIKFSFSQLGLNYLLAEHLSSNPASGKVMKNAGMVHAKSSKTKDRYGKIVDKEIYEIKNF